MKKIFIGLFSVILVITACDTDTTITYEEVNADIISKIGAVSGIASDVMYSSGITPDEVDGWSVYEKTYSNESLTVNYSPTETCNCTNVNGTYKALIKTSGDIMNYKYIFNITYTINGLTYTAETTELYCSLNTSTDTILDSSGYIVFNGLNYLYIDILNYYAENY